MVYSDSTGVEPARRERPLHTDHEGGDEEAHGDTELPLLGCRVLHRLLRATVPPTQAHAVPQRGLPQDQNGESELRHRLHVQ